MTFAETKARASCQGPGCEARPKSAARAPAASKKTHQRADSGRSHSPRQPGGARQGAEPKATRPGHDPPLLGRSDRETDRDPALLAGGLRTRATRRAGPETTKTAWSRQGRIPSEPATQAPPTPLPRPEQQNATDKERPKPATKQQQTSKSRTARDTNHKRQEQKCKDGQSRSPAG